MLLNHQIITDQRELEKAISGKKTTRQFFYSRLFSSHRIIQLLVKSATRKYYVVLTKEAVDHDKNNKLEIDIAILKFVAITIIFDFLFFSYFWLLD